jgi:hypothetical protein
MRIVNTKDTEDAKEVRLADLDSREIADRGGGELLLGLVDRFSAFGDDASLHPEGGVLGMKNSEAR